MHLMSTELALRAFDADVAFSTALAKFQNEVRPGLSPVQAARSASAHGFSWFCRPSEPGFIEVRLRHSGGADVGAEGTSIAELLAGLLGLVWSGEAQADESEEICATRIMSSSEHAELAAEPEPVQAAAESLAAATSGVVVAQPAADPEPDPTTPLTADQKAVAISMIKGLTPDQRQSFTIAFRDCFRVDRSVRTIAPVIQQLQHLQFCDRWSIENAGGVSS
jgi:hypothetical protein